MAIFFGIVAVIAIIVAIICATSKIKVDTATKEINEQIAAENNKLLDKNTELKTSIKQLDQNVLNLKTHKLNLEDDILHQECQLETLQESVKNTLSNQRELSQQAFQSWWDMLEKNYQEKEVEYQNLTNNLQIAYSNEQMRLLAEADECRKDLDKIRSTRDAAIEAQRKEKEIKDKLSFYCLSPSKLELDDIQRLERIKPDLHNPRILSMLIWSTYFQKPMTSLCNNILGTSTITGIYKITNQTNDMCYIGQAVDVAARWKQHAKCGLGIDTPASNKLYKSMIEDGIWNFSWELLEECPQSELNEKEKYYINLYQSYNYGFNNNSGIGK